MNFLELLFVLLPSAIFVAWLVCLVSWSSRRIPIPKYVPILAIGLTVAGALVPAFAFVLGFFTWGLGISCLALPAPATYFVWLWVFGPEFTLGQVSKSK